MTALNDDFINAFKKEINNIHNLVFELPQNRELKKSILRRKIDGYNIKGSLFNVILCEIENEILLNSVAYLKTLGFIISVLVFDGFMVYNDGSNIDQLTPDILKDLSIYINETTGYKVECIIKPFDDSLNIDKYIRFGQRSRHKGR